MRLTDLRGKTVRTADGAPLGRVHEVHCDKGRIVALMCGPGSLIERLTARSNGRRIPWECVQKVEAKHILADPDFPKETAGTSSVARTLRGTRRPSAPRSRR